MALRHSWSLSSPLFPHSTSHLGHEGDKTQGCWLQKKRQATSRQTLSFKKIVYIFKCIFDSIFIWMCGVFLIILLFLICVERIFTLAWPASISQQQRQRPILFPSVSHSSRSTSLHWFAVCPSLVQNSQSYIKPLFLPVAIFLQALILHHTYTKVGQQSTKPLQSSRVLRESAPTGQPAAGQPQCHSTRGELYWWILFCSELKASFWLLANVAKPPCFLSSEKICRNFYIPDACTTYFLMSLQNSSNLTCGYVSEILLFCPIVLDSATKHLVLKH